MESYRIIMAMVHGLIASASAVFMHRLFANDKEKEIIFSFRSTVFIFFGVFILVSWLTYYFDTT